MLMKIISLSFNSLYGAFPPYILCTNDQLAHIAKGRPQTLSDLMKIDGIGKAKADKYGKDILDITLISQSGTAIPTIQTA